MMCALTASGREIASEHGKLHTRQLAAAFDAMRRTTMRSLRFVLRHP
jgi:hypothetical protein